MSGPSTMWRDAGNRATATGAGLAVSTVSELLSGKGKLNRGQIGKLALVFKVKPGVFAVPG